MASAVGFDAPTYSNMKALSTHMAAVTLTEATTAITIPRDVIDTYILPYMKLEVACLYGNTDRRGANKALTEVRKRGYSWLRESDTRKDFAAAKHLHNVRIAVMCGQNRLFTFLTRPYIPCLEPKQEYANRAPLQYCRSLEEICKKDISRITTLTLSSAIHEGPMLLPIELALFKGLTHLFCTNCNLKMVSPVVVKCNKLIKLYLASNKLEALPPYIGRCESLQFLQLANNELHSLPLELTECITLKGIKVMENPLDKDFEESIPRYFRNIVVTTEFPL